MEEATNYEVKHTNQETLRDMEENSNEINETELPVNLKTVSQDEKEGEANVTDSTTTAASVQLDSLKNRDRRTKLSNLKGVTRGEPVSDVNETYSQQDPFPETSQFNVLVSPKEISVSNSNKTDHYTPIQPIESIKSECDKHSLEKTYKTFLKSVPSTVNTNQNLITVRFDFEDIAFASAFDKKIKIEKIKSWLSYILELEEGFVAFYYNNKEVMNSQILADFESQPHSKVIFTINSREGEVGNMQLRAKIKENIPTIDVITVHVDKGEFFKDIVVEIWNESSHKQWLGGFKNKVLGKVYYNAETQTIKEKTFFEIDVATGEKIPLYYERDTQTPFYPVEKTISTLVDKATQMARSDIYMVSKQDKILASNEKNCQKASINYEFYIDYVIMLQRAIRRWLKRKKFIDIINIQKEALQKFKEDRQKIKKDQEDKERAVTIGAVYPVNRDDFYALFLKIEKWWKREWSKICETMSSEARKAAGVKLVEEEIKLLRAIEKHKAASKAESLKKLEIRFLEQISRPVLFRASKGQLTTIDYLDTQKAREFKELYSCLSQKDILPKERIGILIKVKELFEFHYKTYEFSNDLVSLIDREIKLIGINFKSKDLKGLQSRIEQLFLHFLHQPEFNPAAIKHKQPNLPKTLHQTYQCTRCLKLLPASKYAVHVRMKSYSECKSCIWMQNIAHQRKDMSPYIKLLHQVQYSEMEKCCYSALCFILQPIGLAYLTNVIWHGRSAISECSDISKLLHVRWLADVEWAPWNTILLTEQEAKLHESIPDVFKFYDERFIEKIRQKHILARKDFIPLLMMDHDLRSSEQWSKTTDSGVFLHPSHYIRLANDNPDYDTF